MFISITGKPGSGKSYYAVHHVTKNRDNYLNIYTNINGLKMEGNLKALNFKNIVDVVTECKKIYDEQILKLGETEENIIDKPIIDYLLEENFIEHNEDYDTYIEDKSNREQQPDFIRYILDIFKPIYSVPKHKPNLLIIDEAQNHFSKADEVLNWFISYHRHLYIDAILLSQTYQKIHTSYLRDMEYFLYAVPSSRQLFTSSFKYRHHLNTPFFKTNMVETISIKKDKEVFELYESGDKVRTKSVLTKPLIIIFILLVFVYFVWGFAQDMLTSSSSTSPSSPTTHHNIKKNIKNDKKEVILNNLTYLRVVCIADNCTNDTFGKVGIDKGTLLALISNSKSNILKTQNITKQIIIYNILASDIFISYFSKTEKEFVKSFF